MATIGWTTCCSAPTDADRALTVVDWQTVSWGPALTDLAYFLGCALPTEDRRAHYDALLRAYHEALGPGGADHPRRCRRRCSPARLFRRDDGDRLVDAGGAHRARRPDVHDDAATALRSRARYRRVGDVARRGRRRSRCGHRTRTNSPTTRPPNRCGVRAGMPTSSTPHRDWAAGFASVWWPNQQAAWVQALLCGPDLPTVAVVDYEVPLPADPWALRTDAFELGHSRQRTAADLSRRRSRAGSGLFGPVGVVARRAGNSSRHGDESGVGHRRHPVQVPGDDALRNPVHRLGQPSPSTTPATASIRFPGSATTRGVCATGGAWTGCGARCTSTTAPTCTGWTSHIPNVPAMGVGYIQDADRNVTELHTGD